MAAMEQVILSKALLSAETRDRDFESIVREHAGHVYRVAQSVLRNHHDAEDAVQETFMRYLREEQNWAGILNPRAWLAKTAWHVALDRRRKPVPVSLEDAADVVASSARLGGQRRRDCFPKPDAGAGGTTDGQPPQGSARTPDALHGGGIDLRGNWRGAGDSRRFSAGTRFPRADIVKRETGRLVGEESWTIRKNSSSMNCSMPRCGGRCGTRRAQAWRDESWPACARSSRLNAAANRFFGSWGWRPPPQLWPCW